MKQVSFFTLLLLLSAVSFSQKITLNAGVRLRITPIYLRGVESFILSPDPPVLIQQDASLSGLGLSAGINYQLKKNFRLHYTITARHDELITLIDTVTFHNKVTKTLYIDHSFGVSKQLFTVKNKSFYTGLGYSLCNYNSEFSFTEVRINPITGNNEYYIRGDDFKFSTFDILLEMKAKNLLFGLTTSFTDAHKFVQRSNLLIFSLSAKYCFAFKKEK